MSAWGLKVVEQLIANNLIHDVADLYTLQIEDLLILEGFAQKKAENILDAIATSREQPLNRLITAWGIHGVGEVMANDLAQHYKTIDKLQQATLADLETLEGVGPNIAQAIVDWFANPVNQQLLKKIRKVGVWPEVKFSAGPAHDMPFADLTFVITGTLPTYGRDEMKALIQEHGGKVTGSVSKNTSYVLVGENAGSKADKAQELNIPMLSEAQLLAMIK